MSVEHAPHRLVRASAGTGKTYRLTVRFVERLALGAEPRTVLATTFTRKAAGEILDRLLLRLAGAALDREQADSLFAECRFESPDETTGTPSDAAATVLLETLCADLGRVQIATIDAFFHRLSALFRFELGLNRLDRVVAPDDPALEPLRLGSLERALADVGAPGMDALLTLASRLGRGAAQRSVLGSLDRVVLSLYEVYREAPDRAVWKGPDAGSLPVGESVDQALDRLAGVAARLADRGLLKPVTSDLEQAGRRDWLGFLESGIAKRLVSGGEPTFRRRPIPEPVIEAYRPLIEHARHALLRQLADQTSATHELLQCFDRHFAVARRRSGVVLYSELVDGIADLLRGSASGTEIDLLELFYRLDGAVHHLLVDELQDTSRQQWLALLPLVDELTAYAEESRTLFCVGDAKQSIYAWRGACPEVFGAAEDAVLRAGGAVESLRLSFRSAQVVLEAVDRIFEAAPEVELLDSTTQLPAVRRFVDRYERHQAADRELAGYVRLETSARWEGLFEDDEAEIDVEGELDEAADSSEARPRPVGHLDAVADRVLAIVERTSRDGHAGPSIGVLTLTNRTVRDLIERLDERGVEASGEGGGPITDDPAVAVVLAALRLAQNPAATACAYHVAHSPLGPIVGLHDWREADGLSRRLRRSLARDGAAATVAEWARGMAPACDQRNSTRLRQLTELTVRLAADAPTPGELVRRLASSVVEEPSPATVRVMTVHKAKGLEFDVVVLGELERRLGDVGRPLVDRAGAGGLEPVSRIFRATNQTVRQLSPELVEARRSEVERRIGDDLGVLYVAMTRARRELHLVVQPLSGSPRRATLAGVVRHGLAPEAPERWTEGGACLFEAGDRDAMPRIVPASAPRGPVPDRRPRERGESRASVDHRRRLLVRPSDAVAASIRLTAGEILSSSARAGRELGRAVHGVLARIEWLDPEAPIDALELERALRSTGPQLEPDEVRSWSRRLARALGRQPLRDVFARPALGQGERCELWRERRFVVAVDQRLVNGTFDRVVVYSRARAVLGAELYELKLDPADGQGEQLELYRQALARMLGLLPGQVRAVLVHLRSERIERFD